MNYPLAHGPTNGLHLHHVRRTVWVSDDPPISCSVGSPDAASAGVEALDLCAVVGAAD